MLETISRQFRRKFALASLAIGIISTFTHFMTHSPTSPPVSLVTTSAVNWQGAVIIPGGEDRPGHRSARALRLPF
jgi:hypothetical protein